MALILVVDDDANFRALLSSAIVDMGHEVLTAANGVEGLAVAGNYAPHLIISDIIMPEMDGVEMNTLLQLKDRTKGIPILMLTGDVDKHMEVSTRHAFSLSFEYIIGKTAPMERISAIVTEILARYYQL